MSDDAYLRQLPNGKWVDRRYQFVRGDKMHIVDGPYQGHTATVGSRVFLQGSEDEPGYHVTLEDGRWATVRWDMVEGVT